MHMSREFMIEKVSHRHYATGFYYGPPGQYLENARYIREWQVVALVEECDETGLATLTLRNKFCAGDELDVFQVLARWAVVEAGGVVAVAYFLYFLPPDGIWRTACPTEKPADAFSDAPALSGSPMEHPAHCPGLVRQVLRPQTERSGTPHEKDETAAITCSNSLTCQLRVPSMSTSCSRRNWGAMAARRAL